MYVRLTHTSLAVAIVLCVAGSPTQRNDYKHRRSSNAVLEWFRIDRTLMGDRNLSRFGRIAAWRSGGEKIIETKQTPVQHSEEENRAYFTHPHSRCARCTVRTRKPFHRRIFASSASASESAGTRLCVERTSRSRTPQRNEQFIARCSDRNDVCRAARTKKLLFRVFSLPHEHLPANKFCAIHGFNVLSSRHLALVIFSTLFRKREKED